MKKLHFNDFRQNEFRQYDRRSNSIDNGATTGRLVVRFVMLLTIGISSLWHGVALNGQENRKTIERHIILDSEIQIIELNEGGNSQTLIEGALPNRNSSQKRLTITNSQNGVSRIRVLTAQSNQTESGTAWIRQTQGKNKSKKKESYWIGVVCEPIPKYVKSQLRIQSGLVVREVSPLSPAKRSDLRADDIIVKFDDQSVSTLDDLSTSIQIANGRDVEVNIRRSGIPMSLQIQPELRKEEPEQLIRFAVSSVDSPKVQYQSILSAVQMASEGNPRPVSIFVLKPGVLIDNEKVELDFDDHDQKTFNSMTNSFMPLIQNQQLKFELKVRRNGHTFSSGTAENMVDVKWGKCIFKIDQRPIEFFPEGILLEEDQAIFRFGKPSNQFFKDAKSMDKFEFKSPPMNPPPTFQDEFEFRFPAELESPDKILKELKKLQNDLGGGN